MIFVEKANGLSGCLSYDAREWLREVEICQGRAGSYFTKLFTLDNGLSRTSSNEFEAMGEQIGRR